MQDIPLLQGSACWKKCIESIKPVPEFVKQIEYPPVIVNQESTVIVKYPNGLEPSKIESSIVTGEGYKMVDFKSINIENNRLSLPQEPGKYSILMQSAWKTGTTSYIFVVEVK